MLFNSLDFLVLFLPLTLGLSLVLPRWGILSWLTLISCAFYGLMGQWWFLIPMAVTVVIDYLVAQKIEDTSSKKKRRMYLLLSLSANLGLLIAFKYAFFIAENGVWVMRLFKSGAELPSWSRHLAVILPAGISFYTFQTLSYIIDVWKGRCHAERDFAKFTSFVTFFPHLVAGPLTRHNQLIPQLERLAKHGIRPRWQEGVSLFAMGLCKKVLVADQIASLIDPRIGGVASADLVTSWMLLLGYTFQIYFDFSGYSDMAIGLGRLWGVELPMNFNKPYAATDPSDFWRRWHITLSQWLRDYVYIPLGGNRSTAARTDLNAMITMCLGGLWHGANWTFVLWGFYHGMLLVLHRRGARTWSKMSGFHQRNAMFLLATIGWLFFRADNMAHLGAWTQGLLGFHGVLNWDALNAWRQDFTLLGAMLVGAFLLSRLGETALTISLRKSYRAVHEFGLGLATAASIVLMSHSSYFLYFRF